MHFSISYLIFFRNKVYLRFNLVWYILISRWNLQSIAMQNYKQEYFCFTVYACTQCR